MLMATVTSSVIQPLFGYLSDRSARRWILPSSVALAGLGLALTQKIVEDHGGSIDVRSVPGAGALFRIVLPLMPDVPLDTGHDDRLG